MCQKRYPKNKNTNNDAFSGIDSVNDIGWELGFSQEVENKKPRKHPCWTFSSATMTAGSSSEVEHYYCNVCRRNSIRVSSYRGTVKDERLFQPCNCIKYPRLPGSKNKF